VLFRSYDNDYEVVPGITIEDIFIDSDNYFDNTIEWNILNNQYLDEIFIDSQLLTNPDFTFNISNWGSNGTLTWDNGYASIIRTATSALLFQTAVSMNINNKYYIRTNIDQNIPLTSWRAFNGTSYINFGNTPPSNQDISGILEVIVSHTSLNIQYFSASTVDVLVDYVYMYNLTDLGIDTLTKTNIDNFFILFENINTNNFIYTGYLTTLVNPTFGFDNKLLNLTDIFGAGNEPNQATIEQYYDDYLEYLEYLYVCCNIFATQTLSFETIYFDDGVSTEIERLGSILIFTLIGFTLMIFGFASKRRIFNLLAVGAFVVLGFLLIEFVGFIIILFGLIFVNVYYTFFGEL
jgi:hypothetical protein